MPLNVVVCLKQIPNPDLQFQVSADGKDIKRDALNYKTNVPDEYALEEAVRLKEKHGGKVTAITVGPKRTEQMLREAMAKGADAAVRIAFDNPIEFDVVKVARILAAGIRAIPHDIVLTGVQSDDNANSVTGALLGGLLGHWHASVVTRIAVEGQTVAVSRELEGGDQAVVEISLPAVLTLQFGINVPRYAPLPAIMKASRQPIQELTAAALGVSSWDDFGKGYHFRLEDLSPPEARGRAEMVTGAVGEQARKVAQILRETGFFRG